MCLVPNPENKTLAEDNTDLIDNRPIVHMTNEKQIRLFRV